MGEIGERWEKSSQAGSCHNEERIVVSVRLRPLNVKERERNDVSDWECISEDTVIFRNNLPVPERSVFPTAYTFDRVFRHDCSTKQVYEEAAKEVALSVVGGINSSIFAYGQTSSGKTYTMTGVTEYAVADIYDYVQRHKERNFILKFSAMEIYNEAVRDLLSSDTTPRRLLDDPERGTVVDKLTEETLRDWNHVQELLSLCEAQRQIGETSLNETSSRSHQIIRLSIESSPREFLGKDNSGTLAASVDFIDLAGSERASQAHSAGTRLKEGCHINRSLLTLGTVVRKLSKGRNGHIPYRDSKLTRILQCSLGGNARTAIICTISPARTHVEQSRNTLLFASCAKEVSTNAQVNVVMSDKVLVKHLQRELARLESELKGPTLTSTPSDSAALLIEKDLQIEKMQREIKELIQQRDLAQSRLVDLVEVVGDDQTPRHWSAYNQRPRCYATNSWEDDHSTSTSSGVGDHHSIDTGVTRVDRSWYSNEHSGSNVDDPYLHVPENPEDQSLSNGDSPRHSISSTRFVRPDHCQVWEEETTQNTEEDFEENCKEVRCIEMEEPSVNRKVQSNTFEDPEKCEEVVPLVETSNEDRTEQELISYMKKEDKEFKHVDSDLTYGALEQKLQDVQKTIDSLVNPFPGQPSPWSPAADSSSTRSLKLARSRSCKEILLSNSSSPWLQKAEQYERSPNVFEKYVPERSEGFERNFSVISRGTSVKDLSREDSQTSEQSASTDEPKAHNIKSSAEEDITSIRTFVAGLKEMAKLQHEKHLVDEKEKVHEKENVQEEEEEKEEEEDEEEEEKKENVQEEKEKEKEEDEEEVQETKPKTDEPRRSVKDVGLDPVEDSFESPSRWTLEFERLQREIVELWATCNISLIHRSYFFLLFKGDPTDSIYLEVELRRLSFLKDNISKGNLKKLTMEGGQDLSPDSSKKVLRREREMLCKQLQKRFSEEERLNLYRKWGIQLDTKQRKQQLAQLLWSKTKDMNHIIDSASLVAKLIGLLEPGQAPKEMFGLSFSPRYTARRSYSWKSMSSLV